ncbi:MAG: exopolyphosphatase [Deltaproteobacteria bacterium]|nr:exopolyphosphatase [Deltaproteobacteria bacterium]
MRLITRSDFDGLVCAALLEELGITDEVLYVHPKDLQDNKIDVTENDVLANVPLVEGCGLWFDHHSSEEERLQLKGKFKGACEAAPSAAHVICKYYMANEDHVNKLNKFEELIAAVDKADSAGYSREDILDPQGWMMLAFIADPRTGLGYHQHFRISNFDLMKTLPGLLRTKSVEEILATPDFEERVDFYREETEKFQAFISEKARVEGDAIVLDLRGIKDIPSGNRFIEYTLYPDQNISVRLVDGKMQKFVMISIGHSIINKSSRVDVGSLALKYGGGGHRQVGTCQVPYEAADTALKEILDAINA